MPTASDEKLPDANTVRVHVASVALGCGKNSSLLELLSDDERSRALRFRNPIDEDAYVAAHAHLRRWLGHALGVPPQEVPIVAALHEKPRLALAAPWRFSLSHTRGFVAVALAFDREVGVDVERLHRLRDEDALASQVLSARERAYLASLRADDKSAAILSMWVTKEAYFKAKGLPIEADPRLLDTGPGEEPTLCVPTELDLAPASWRLWRRAQAGLWTLAVGAWDPLRETTLALEEGTVG